MSAPNFVLKDIEGNLINLRSYQGKKVLLSFFRYASCPFCNLRVHELIQRYPHFQSAGLSIITVFESPLSQIRRYVGRQKPPFPIIADPQRRLYQQYGVQSSWWAYLKSARRLNRLLDAIFNKGYHLGRMDGDKAIVPADFLLNPGMTLHTVFYGSDISDHLPLEIVEAFIQT